MRLTESGSDQAKAGVSMADMIRAIMAEEMAKITGGPVATQAVNHSSAKGKAAKVKPARVAEPKAPSTGKWYLDLLARVDKSTGNKYYSVDESTILVHGDVAIMRSSKWAPVLVLVKGRRKPLYLRAQALGSLLDAVPTLNRFVDVNADYLERSMSDSSEGDE
jgi:hypothetical protein